MNLIAAFEIDFIAGALIENAMSCRLTAGELPTSLKAVWQFGRT